MFYKGHNKFLPRNCPLYLFSKMFLKFCSGIVAVPYRLSLIHHTNCSRCSSTLICGPWSLDHPPHARTETLFLGCWMLGLGTRNRIRIMQKVKENGSKRNILVPLPQPFLSTTLFKSRVSRAVAATERSEETTRARALSGRRRPPRRLVRFPIAVEHF